MDPAVPREKGLAIILSDQPICNVKATSFWFLGKFYLLGYVKADVHLTEGKKIQK